MTGPVDPYYTWFGLPYRWDCGHTTDIGAARLSLIAVLADAKHPHPILAAQKCRPRLYLTTPEYPL